jgi:glycosyltransferase involved in cell wall biosynthesis
MARPLIAFITADDPRDKRSWSGTNHFMLESLKKHVGDVEILGPYKPKMLWFFCSAFNYLTLRLLGKRFDYRHSNAMRRAYGKHFSQLLAEKKYDVAVVSASIASAAGIKSNTPIVYINDRVIAGAMNYHKVLTQLFAFSKQQSLANDKHAIDQSSLSVFCSDWAADAAKKIAEDHSKVKMIPFGANLETIPDTPPAIEFPSQKIRLLFVGVNWEDKGGPVAYAAFRNLVDSGIEAELTIAGCTPPSDVIQPGVNAVGFLNKNVPAEFEKLNALFRTSHFFILPTKYEAYGLVFCEAGANGIPALAPATGGIPTIIEDGVTGFLLPENSVGKAYADKMRFLIENPERWQNMRKAAYAKYIDQLNWDAWGTAMNAALKEKGIIS